MVSCLVSLVLSATLGQAPADGAWLKNIPADVEVVARVKSLETARDDLLKMLEAMSGNAAAMAKPQIEQGMNVFSAMHGDGAVKYPFVTMLKIPKGGAAPAWAVLTQSTKYDTVLKSISRKQDVTKKSLGDHDSFETADGQTFFSAQLPGYVAFGPDEAMIKSVVKPAAALDEKLSAELRERLLGGDLGLYVNLGALQAEFGEQIDGAKGMLMGAIDQAGPQLGNGAADAAKNVYAALFDALKVGDALVLNLDFAAEALTISGGATVKPDSSTAKNLASAKTGAGDGLAKLPASGVTFAYLNLNPATLQKFQRLGLSFMSGGKESPELKKALEDAAKIGVGESYSSTSGSGSTKNLALSYPTDPALAITSATELFAALKGGGFFKDIAITPKAETYKGFTFNIAKATLDLEKITPPNAPGGAEAIKKTLGGDTVTTWYGTDGKAVISVSASSWDEARTQIDSILSGEGSIGSVPAYKALRARLSDKATILFMVNAQGLVTQIANQIATMAPNAPKVPADMPKTPALLGGSLTATPKGYQFQLLIPSDVGPVIEKGLVPVLQGMQRPIN